MKFKAKLAAPLFIALAVILAVMGCAKPMEVKQWRFGTSEEGSFGYSGATAVAKVVNQYAKTVQLNVAPAKSSTQTHYLYDSGDLDIVLVSSLQILDYFNDTGTYKEKPVQYKTPIGLSFFSVGQFVITKADRQDIKSYADLAGKNVAPGVTGSMNWIIFKEMMNRLGIWDKINDRQMDLTAIADALSRGVVDAVSIYTIGAGKSIPSWIQTIDSQVKIKVVNPTEQEKAELLKIPGLGPAELPVSAFNQDVGVPSIWTLAYFMGWNFGPREDTDHVYEVTKTLFEHAAEVANYHPGLWEFSNDPWGININFIKGMPGIPVHSGVAKYFKEMGKWDNSWKIAE